MTRTQAVAPVAGVIALGLYLATMSRSVGPVDCGELAACAWTLGTPHPTGYPTLMLLGYAVTHLVPLAPILTLNLLAACLTAASVIVLTFLFDHVLAGIFAAGAGSRRIVAGLAALFTGLTGAWWQQAVSFEVYSLHVVMLALVSWLFLRYVDEESHREAAAKGASRAIGFTRRGTLFAFALGVSFTNHMTTGLLAPAFLALFVAAVIVPGGVRAPRLRGHSAWGRALRRVLFLLPAFLLGVLPPYLWMMIRAGAEPRFNWGDPSTFEALLYHLAGRDYRHAMGHLFDRGFAERFVYFLRWLPPAVGYLGVPAALAGLIVLWRRSWRMGLWSLLLFAASVLYACSYTVNDLDNYFVGAVLAVGLWSAVAAGALTARWGARIAVAALAALVLATGASNFARHDRHDDAVAADFAADMLGTLPPSAIVFTRQWDFWESAAFYAQAVKGVRRDVMVVDADLLYSDWYVDQLSRAYPQVMGTVRAEAERVRAGCRGIRRARPVTQAQLVEYAHAYAALVNALVDRNGDARPCFMTYDPFGPELAPGYLRVPWGLAQRLTRDSAYLPAEFPRYGLRMWRRRVVPQVVWTQKLYAEACLNRAVYERENNHEELARRYAELAVSFDPGFRDKDVPDFPGAIEDQLKRELRRFEQAKSDLERGILSAWYAAP